MACDTFQISLPELATPLYRHPFRQRHKPRPQDQVRQLLAHHFCDPHDGGGGPGVHVHDPGEVADDEVDPGVASQAQGQSRHLRRPQDLLLPVRAAGDDPALVLKARLDRWHQASFCREDLYSEKRK